MEEIILNLQHPDTQHRLKVEQRHESVTELRKLVQKDLTCGEEDTITAGLGRLRPNYECVQQIEEIHSSVGPTGLSGPPKKMDTHGDPRRLLQPHQPRSCRCMEERKRRGGGREREGGWREERERRGVLH